MVFQKIRNKLKLLSFWKHFLVIALPVICYPLIEEFFGLIYRSVTNNAPKLNLEMHFCELGLNLCSVMPIIGHLSYFLWYAIVALLFINIPLAEFLQCFKEKKRYEFYKKFWWITLFIFSFLSTLLYLHHTMEIISLSPLRFISSLFCVLYLTLIPGAYLYSKQSKSSDNNSACFFSTMEYRWVFAIIAIALFTVSSIKLHTLTDKSKSISRAVMEAVF